MFISTWDKWERTKGFQKPHWVIQRNTGTSTMKMCYPEEGTIQVHQTRVCPCHSYGLPGSTSKCPPHTQMLQNFCVKTWSRTRKHDDVELQNARNESRVWAVAWWPWWAADNPRDKDEVPETCTHTLCGCWQAKMISVSTNRYLQEQTSLQINQVSD